MAIRTTVSYSGYVAQNLAASLGHRFSSASASASGSRLLHDGAWRPFCIFTSTRQPEQHRNSGSGSDRHDGGDHNHPKPQAIAAGAHSLLLTRACLSSKSPPPSLAVGLLSVLAQRTGPTPGTTGSAPSLAGSSPISLGFNPTSFLPFLQTAKWLPCSDLATSSSSACLVPHRPRRSCVFGQALAEESPAPGADVVIPVPDSGFYAALGFARASGLEFQQGLIRWHYSGRSFIQPTQAIRDLAVKLKLAPVRGVITGKSVVVVDDSLVRGTTSSKIVRLLHDVVGSCLYGIDTPSEGELISNRMDLDGVRREIGSDSLAFLSLDKLHSIYGEESGDYCDACFSRKYPVLPTLADPAAEPDE